ncbi:MAG: NADP-dependent malic enzyme, partial [Planctomycetota bacterium]
LDTEDPDAFCNAVKLMGPTFGGINLEDIKAPDCFVIEERLKELMDIPVFHDDQHGTAIIAAAGIVNACDLTGRTLDTVKLVCNGAGAAGIASLDLLTAMGMKRENIILCDSKGVIYEGRSEGMNQWKSTYASGSPARTLEDALVGADCFFGLSVAGAVTRDMVASMADNPIIFAMANPDPEITPEEVAAVRSDAIMATGRSDYPNQVNNVLGFPFIFRGALDVQASTINMAMKIAAAEALADLARADVPDEVAASFHGKRPRYGPDYIIPAPFDPRLIREVPTAVAKAAMDSGVARRQIVDLDGYKAELAGRLDPVTGWLQSIFTKVREEPKRIVFAEGEQPEVVRAANTFANSGLGEPVLIGRQANVEEAFQTAGIEISDRFIIHDASKSDNREEYTSYLFNRLQRRGFLYRDCQRMVNTDRNIFGSCMVAMGHADGLVTGVTRNWSIAYDDICKVLDPKPDHRVIGVSLVLSQGRTVLVADTSIHDMPTTEELADIATEAAGVARRLGYEPRVAMLAFSTFGHPEGERSNRVREAVQLLDARNVDFEYEGEMGAEVALSRQAMAQYPFCRLSDTANVLVMPAFHSASISTNMLKELGNMTVIGPLLVGLQKSVQIVRLGATDNEILNAAALAVYDISAS